LEHSWRIASGGFHVHVLAALGVRGALASLRFQPGRGVRSGSHRAGLHGRAGYDPHQAKAFWKRMLRASKGKDPPEFASDHPTDQHRGEQIAEWLPETERVYKPPQQH
jgi:hypothetical protein